MPWPEEQRLKILPGDHSYIDYLHQRPDNSFRIRNQRCQYISMERAGNGIWTLDVGMTIVPLPLPANAPKESLREQGILSERFPDDVPALLSGGDIRQFSN